MSCYRRFGNESSIANYNASKQKVSLQLENEAMMIDLNPQMYHSGSIKVKVGNAI